MSAAIEVLGARTNNLKNITCRFPHGRLTVVTGLSGSGKSSLAFDTLYAEGQRRYVESMSTYARQFLEKIRRPDVDAIHNIQPAIAIEQKNAVKNARSTIGTATEVHDYLRLLFAKAGKTWCPACDIAALRHTPESAAQTLVEAGGRVTLIAPVHAEAKALPGVVREMLATGFSRAWGLEGIKDLEALTPDDLDADSHLWAVVDRLAPNEEERSRLTASLELAFRTGGGRAAAVDESGARRLFHARLACPNCGRSFREPEPLLFSFLSPLGACPVCQGYGRVIGIDWEKVIPNRNLSLKRRAIAPWNTPANEPMYEHLEKTTSAKAIRRDVAIADMTKAEWKLLVEGKGEYIGIKGFFDWMEGRKYRVQARVFLSKYRSYTTCGDCGGTRLQPDALNVRVDGRTIADIAAMSIADLEAYFAPLRLPPVDEQAVERVLQELRSRLRFLKDVGLGYLTLARQTRTLSGGESQRINLAASLGSALTDTLYVLDEPTVGLHARDTDRLIRATQALRDLGNTLVVVEHDPEFIAAADRILDLGPEAGEKGGHIVFEGEASEFFKLAEGSATARHHRRHREGGAPSRAREPKAWVRIAGARGNNLKNLTVDIPLGVLCCVTGVSGSGKSTLVQDTLYAGFKRERESASIDVCPYDRIDGLAALTDIILVDQTPIGRSTRSNPVTYVKAYEPIRALLAAQREAKRTGVQARDFSFNVAGGRCERCEGAGVEVVDMHFLADVEVICAECDGKRFQRRVLEIQYRGKNVDDILDLTVDEAMAFFGQRGAENPVRELPASKPFAGLPRRRAKSDAPGGPEARIIRALQPLADVGLGYIRLGQSTASLSGGEAQRLKLAQHLAAVGEGRRIMLLFDEPTTGLHLADLERLASVLHRLVDEGASVVVIEHNLELIRQADWLIDLGPDGGDDGGRIVAAGIVGEVIRNKDSVTGHWLKKSTGRYRPA